MNKVSKNLQEVAYQARKSCLKMATKGGCFLGASLSCVDILNFLYGKFLNHNPNLVNDINRDYLFLSKGHDVPALYSVLAEYGYMSTKKLDNHLSPDDSIYWHPNTKISGVEFHSGSLGHLPSVSLGVSIDLNIRKSNSKVFTILGDGELNEGSVWESILIGSSMKLKNFCLIIDRNNFQANGPTEEIIPLNPLKEKFESFGCQVFETNGHDYEKLESTFNSINFSENSIKVVICNTIRGKGIPSIEGKADKWFCSLNEEMYESLLKELETGKESGIELPSTCVR